MSRTPCALVVALLLMMMSAPAARAQPLWEVGAGAAALSLPDYRGSDERHQYLLPFPYVVYRGERIRADREGLRARLFDSERFDLDFSAHGNFALRSRDNVARQGMPSLHPMVELGPEVYYRLLGDRHSPWRLDARFATRFAYSIGDGRLTYRGAVASPYLRLDVRNVAGTGFDVTSYAGLLYGDRRYHGYLYTVDPAFATGSRPAFSASGGYAGSLAQIGAGRRFGNLWVGGFIRYDSLSGAVFESSPLVRSQRYATAGIAAAWVLGASGRRAGSDD